MALQLSLIIYSSLNYFLLAKKQNVGIGKVAINLLIIITPYGNIIFNVCIISDHNICDMNKKIGFTTGVFDLFHIGHLRLLEKAKTEL